MAYIAILVIVSTALLIITMDILKYVLKIETVEKAQQKKTKMKNQRRKITIVHHVYVNASNWAEKTLN